VVQLLETLPADHACTLVVVTHNRAIAARAPRRVQLELGAVRGVR
jgi:predicted ABC-type transport system involved in lysophospholipase L1 biosynthesis ATPase subunit